MMENFSKNKITIIGLLVGLILAIIFFLIANNYEKNLDMNLIIAKGQLKEFVFKSYDKDKDGYVYTVTSAEDGRKYENIFLSKTCPGIEARAKEGMKMKLVKVSNINSKTQITYNTFDRAYDYLCTNKNMSNEDEALMKKIEEAKDTYFNGIKENLSKQNRL